MDHYCAPQWVDFTSSPQVPSDDYFETYHDIFEPKISTTESKNNIKMKNNISTIIETPKKSVRSQDESLVKLTPNFNENYETEIDSLKNTPIKVIYTLKNSSSKHEIVKEVTYDNVLHEAMQNLHKVKKEIDFSLQEHVFKKPMPIKLNVSKPVRVRELDKRYICIASSEETQEITKGLPDETTKSVSSNMDMSKSDDSSMKTTKDVTKITQIQDHLKSNINDSTVRNDNSKIKVENNNMKLKPPIVKQQTSKACTGVSTKVNTLNRFVTTCKQNKTEELKSKTVKKDQAKPKHIEHNSINSSALLKRTAQKSRVLNTDSIVKVKQTSKESETLRSCSSSVGRQERVSSRKSTTSKKIISALVDNGSEIIIKKKKILFFDIPVHSKQKKTTCPVPFSFENRNKIKKQLQLDQLESASIKSESVTGVKSVLDINKTQKNKNKFGNFARNGVTSFCSHRVTNEKDKNIKQPEKCEKVGTYMSSVTMRKPMRAINALKDNNHKKEKEKIEKRKIEDIQNKKDANREQNPLKSILYRNIHINKNTKIQAKETLQISKRVQKENRQPNINVSTTTNNKNLNQKQEVKPKSTAVKINVDERGKKHEFEERMKQKKLMHEEKLRKEREEKLAKEKLEIAKLRKQAEIKARPMPVYKPLIHIKSTKPLTKPQSPAWSNKHRVTMIKETS